MSLSAFPPRPVRKPLMFQAWRSITFLHWRYEPGEIQPLLPRGLTCDLFDGAAWIGMTPFGVADLRPPFLPPVPWLSKFPETNVRTYVRGPDGEPGIWFFTLEAARLAAVCGARLLYGLPYRWSRMQVRRNASDSVHYESVRGSPQPVFNQLAIKIGEPITGVLETFLTARFRLYTRLSGRLAFADVEHEPWPLHRAQIEFFEQNLVASVGPPPPRGEPLAHYSRGVYVRIGRPHFA